MLRVQVVKYFFSDYSLQNLLGTQVREFAISPSHTFLKNCSMPDLTAQMWKLQCFLAPQPVTILSLIIGLSVYS